MSNRRQKKGMNSDYSYLLYKLLSSERGYHYNLYFIMLLIVRAKNCVPYVLSYKKRTRRMLFLIDKDIKENVLNHSVPRRTDINSHQFELIKEIFAGKNEN